MNRRFKITALLFTTIAISAFAQDDKDSTKLWSRGGVVRLQFSQASLTNWAAGGESSIAGTSFLSLFANYAKGKVNWDNTVDLAYGLQKLGTGNWVKSDDKIDLSSKLGIKGKNAWFYSAQLSFKSQFAPGYKLPNDSVVIADFLSPAYVLASLGMDYKPNKDFSLLIAPL
ncbi:MAG: DUF3078 domain-containing protein, partial [Flavobacteriales bacterium]|nr:DUF3078 domain-containing protein [Flavobacteriales bacterium]